MAEHRRTKFERDLWRHGTPQMGAVEFVKSLVTDAIQTGEIPPERQAQAERTLARTYMQDAPAPAKLALALFVREGAEREQKTPHQERERIPPDRSRGGYEW